MDINLGDAILIKKIREQRPFPLKNEDWDAFFSSPVWLALFHNMCVNADSAIKTILNGSDQIEVERARGAMMVFWSLINAETALRDRLSKTTEESVSTEMIQRIRELVNIWKQRETNKEQNNGT